MLGDVWVTVVLLESNGAIDANTEDWTAAEIDRVKSEIRQGLQWWEDTLAAHPGLPAASRQELDFHIDFTYADAPVATNYEPINRPHNDEAKWVNDFLKKVGYSTDNTSAICGVGMMPNACPQHGLGLHRICRRFSNDPDGQFTDGYFAYAWPGGPFMVMTTTTRTGPST